MKFLLACLLLAAAAVQDGHGRYVRRRPASVDSAVRPVRPSHHVKGNGGNDQSTRIIGGSDASLGQFPWQAALRIDERYFCGGSLITRQTVLTAGHCADGAASFLINLGTLSSSRNPPGAVTVTSDNGIVHPDYGVSNSDVAVVRLSEMVTLNDVIDVVRLPSASQVDDTFAGLTALISGWGQVSDENTALSPTLQYTGVSIITNAQCAEESPGDITDGHICTKGANNETPCYGDSGGPLVIQESDGRWTQVGLDSFGSYELCASGAPEGYTRVTAYLDWINENSV